MADEALAKAGLHFDELNKIRVLEPDVAQQTRELKEECKDFVDSCIFHQKVEKFTRRRKDQTLKLNEWVSVNEDKSISEVNHLDPVEIGEFQKIVGTFIEMVDAVAKEVEKEKMKAIGARNLLKSIAKQREAQQLQLQALITEKRMQLERLRIQHDALQKEESDQADFLDQLLLQK